MDKQDGGRAFPRLMLATSSEGRLVTHSDGGMSLRDWFAGTALQGYLASPTDGWNDLDDLAEGSYRLADAMLAARHKP